MHILPAVDIKGGKAVRLFQGEKDKETVYNDSPVAAALRWVNEGATYLHVVDLDGAFDGVSENEQHIEAIVKAVKIPVEVGGGIRTLEKAQRLVGFGVDRVIIGTKALQDMALLRSMIAALPGRVNVGVDAREGFVSVKGWTETSGKRAEDFLRELSGLGVAAIIYTDISRDGALAGVNYEAMKRATEVTDVPIIASGGVTSVEDIRKLKDLPLFGIISGKALYDGRLTLQEAMAALK
jgi:phosphoribosylformimino-5-aminoimidazole carboxamide ribotide isomerase